MLGQEFRYKITSPDDKTRRLPRKYFGVPSWTRDRTNYYAEFSFSTTIPWEDQSFTNIKIGDCVEFFYKNVRHYRGYISGLAPSEEEPRTLNVSGYGRMQELRNKLVNKLYIYPLSGTDVAYGFADFAKDAWMSAYGLGGVKLINSVDSKFIGTNVTQIDAVKKIAGDVLDQEIVTQAGNLSVSGVDVDSNGGDRAFLRPIKSLVDPTFRIPIPSLNTEATNSEVQSADVKNALLIIGTGKPRWPQFLHNGNFEDPTPHQESQDNLVQNADFETGTTGVSGSGVVDHWDLQSGATTKLASYNSPEIKAPYSGSKMLELDHAGEQAVQYRTGLTFTTGDNYTLGFRAAKGIDLQTVAGHCLVEILNSSDGVLYSAIIPVAPLTTAYEYFSDTFKMPASAVRFRLTFHADTVTAYGGRQGGLYIDAIELYDADAVYQDGWVITPAGSAVVNSIKWNYQDEVYEGSYSVKVDCSAADASGQDVTFENPTNSIAITSGKTYRFGGMFKSPRSSQHPYIPTLFDLNVEWRHGDNTYKSTDSVGIVHSASTTLSDWTYFEIFTTAPGDASLALPKIVWRSNGSLLIDALSFREGAAPLVTDYYQQEGGFLYLVKANDTYLNDTFLSSPATYRISNDTYGDRWAVVSEGSVATREDALALADNFFSANALAYYRPSITLTDDERIFDPGDSVKLTGRDGSKISADTLTISRVKENYDGILHTSLEIEREQPDMLVVVKRIVDEQLRKNGISDSTSFSGGFSGSGSGGTTGGGGIVGTPSYRTTLQASPTDSTLHDDYRTGPHISDAEHTSIGSTHTALVGGTTGQILSKVNGTDLNTVWIDPPTGTGGSLLIANNLSDLANVTTARTNLGLGTAAVHDIPASGNASSSQIVFGDDTRLANSRTPSAHASTHASGGSDPVSPTSIGALAVASNLSDVANASTSRTNLGLGTIAVQSASSVTITGGSITGITDLAVADGGTGASTASSARTNLGLGTSATHDVAASGDASSSQVVLGNDSRLGSVSGTNIVTIAPVFDGGNAVLTTGVWFDIPFDYNCTIQKITMLADQSGSVVIDIWKDTYANYPPTVGDSICASAKPTISSAAKSQDSTLTGWTTNIAAGDTLRFNVDSCTAITRVTLGIKVLKT